MSDWPYVTLSAVCDKPHYGAIAKGSPDRVGPLFVRQTDIASGRIDWSSVPFCDLPESEFKKYAIHAGDVLVSRLGNGVGNAATVGDDTNGAVFAGYLVRFRARPEAADPSFLGFELQSQAWRQHVAGFRSGAAQPTLNAQQMGEFEFLLPPLNEQREIAATLGTLDDKIESNRRAAHLLSVLVDALAAQLLDSEPTRSLLLSDVVDFNRLTVKPNATERLDYIDIASVSPGRVDAVQRLTWPEAPSRARRGVSDIDVIFSTVRPGRRSYALLIDPSPITVASTGFAVMTAKPTIGASLLVSAVATSEFAEYLESVAQGSAYPAVSVDAMGRYAVTIPADPSDAAAFDAKTMPMRRLAALLDRESTRLGSVRDALLPGLLSGRIRVPEAADTMGVAA